MSKYARRSRLTQQLRAVNSGIIKIINRTIEDLRGFLSKVTKNDLFTRKNSPTYNQSSTNCIDLVKTSILNKASFILARYRYRDQT